MYTPLLVTIPPYLSRECAGDRSYPLSRMPELSYLLSENTTNSQLVFLLWRYWAGHCFKWLGKLLTEWGLIEVVYIWVVETY